MVTRGVRHVVAATAIIAVIAYIVVFSGPGDAPIHSDGYSYYVYLPSAFLYRDLTLEKLAADWYRGPYPDFTGIRRWPSTGRWMNLHPIGTVAIGYARPNDRPSPSLNRGHRPAAEIIHRGKW